MFRAGKEYRVRHNLKYLPRDIRGRTFEVIRDVSHVKLPTFDFNCLKDDTEAKYRLINVCPSECEEVLRR